VSRLDRLDLSLRLSRKEQERLLEHHGARLAQLRLALGGQLGSGDLGPPLCVRFEGWDAAGTGGAIKRLVAPLDARHVRVVSFAAPTPDEKRHHYLHRFVGALPGWGGMAVLDRSWYGRVLVERVEGFARESEWKRAYDEIVAFEQGLHREGMVLVKFWLHISQEEQLRRFERRERIPLKAWKLTEEDWRNREKRPAYEAAVEEMLERTDHEGGRWHVVPGNSKKYARQAVLDITIEAAERAMREHGMEPIDAEELGL
jgi:polyphosphate kinase 2 (PPK2 family)